MFGSMASLVIELSYFNIEFVWVPGHCGLFGNCKVNELLRKGSLTQNLSRWDRVGFPLSSRILALDLKGLRELNKRWLAISTYAAVISF